jgi:predicted MPP superfamily phosphohydrolase
MLIFFSIFFTVYSAVNYYIFIRGWQALALYPHLRIYYSFIFIFFALSYIIARIFSASLPSIIYDILLWCGSFWFAFMLYFFLTIICLDFFRLIVSIFNFKPEFIYTDYDKAKFITSVIILVVVSIIIFAGYINTRTIDIKTINLELPKGKGKLNELNVVLTADFHLTPVNDGKLLSKIVGKINELNPDIVLMPGDIVDDKVSILKRKSIGNQFLNIKTKYGVYASTGNHEFITGVEEAVSYIEKVGIHVLSDSSILIDDSFYIIGRDDRVKFQFTGKERKSLKEIMAAVDKNYPSILLDHTPLNLEEAEQNNIGLQLSGHTHHGQLFPANLITSLIYEVSRGYLRKGNTQYYVTAGVGTWGPPVRTGSSSEIVNIKIKFVE